MTPSLLASMSAFALVASISPGPVNLVGLKSGSHHSIGQGLVFVTGATLGFVALFIGIGLGLHTLLVTTPWLNASLRWAGVIFLLYMSVRLARDSGRIEGPAKSHKAPGFITGAAMQWLNPKAWLASASGISAYASGNDVALWVFAALYLPICWASLAAWVFAGAYLRRYVSRPSLMRWLNRMLAALLGASCLLLVID